MRNLSLFWIWLLLSVIVLTWFWHVLFMLIVYSIFATFLVVKNKSTWRWQLYLLAWLLVWSTSVYLSLSRYLSQEWLDRTKTSVLVQFTQQVKPTIAVAKVYSKIDYQSIGTYRIESDELPDNMSILYQWVIDTSTLASLPSISRNWTLQRNALEFDYPIWLFMKWYQWQLTISSFHAYDWIALSHISWTDTLTYTIRQKLRHVYSYQTAWLLEWMMIWWRAWLSDYDYETFIESWLVHIIAVSWSNIIMIVFFLTVVLFWLPRSIRIVCILPLIVCYCLIVWLDSSVFRALVMWVTMLLALLWWRRISIYRSLWYACIILLIVNPWVLIYDIWFALSFGALLWIVLVASLTKHILSNWYITTYATPTLWATLWVLPVLVIVMDWINLVSVVANISIIPLIPLLLLSWIGWLILWEPFIRIAERLVQCIMIIANYTAQYWITLEVSWLLSKVIFLLMMISICIIFHSISESINRQTIRA